MLHSRYLLTDVFMTIKHLGNMLTTEDLLRPMPRHARNNNQGRHCNPRAIVTKIRPEAWGHRGPGRNKKQGWSRAPMMVIMMTTMMIMMMKMMMMIAAIISISTMPMINIELIITIIIAVIFGIPIIIAHISFNIVVDIVIMLIMFFIFFDYAIIISFMVMLIIKSS